MVVPPSSSRCTVAFQFQAVGILKTGSWIVIVKGNTRGTAPAGASALPLITICCGWNGALPPRAVSRLMAVRLANMPRPARREVLLFRPYARPRRGWNTVQWVSARPSGSPWKSRSNCPVWSCGKRLPSAFGSRLPGSTMPLYGSPLTMNPPARSMTAALEGS